MTTQQHPLAELSAYIDGALDQAARAAVERHLVACPSCPLRLEELRATARLIAALPDPAPGRRLVPRLAGAPAWLAPLRTLASLASGVSVFLFAASILVQQATAPGVGAALNASSAERGATTSAAGAAPAAPSAAAPAALDRSASSPTSGFAASPSPRADQPLAQGAQPAPSAAPPQDAVAKTVAEARPALGPSPWLWLGLALASGLLAFALHRRLRVAR